MIADILTHPTFIASVICFILGSFGYILFRLWFSPMMQYRKTKKNIRAALMGFDSAESKKTQLRQYAATLSSVYYDTLPYWYQLLLEKRNEDPIQAASLLMKLSNTRDKTHASRQTKEIMACLQCEN
ncbi:MAG: hypothetical protein RBT11_17440 [Desulfobacterales bacterium]|jgi:hypothetical protein|nr:hypothetical protein [Desulfobacterales bacterium]